MTDFYAHGLQEFLCAQIAYNTDNIAAVLLDLTQYTANLGADQFLSDIPVGARVSTSPYLTGKTFSGGVAGADTYTFPTPTGSICRALAYYKDTGSPASSPLISYHDSASVGLPVTPNGSNISIVLTAGYVFKLGGM